MAWTSIFWKRLFFDRTLEKSYWTWRRHPVIIVPTMLGIALSLIEQSVVATAVIILLTNLSIEGRLPSFLTRIVSGPLGLFGLLSDPTFGPSLIFTGVVGIVVVLIVAVVGGGFIRASEYGTYVQASTNERVSVGSVVENGSRRWKPMAWTLIVSNLVTWAPVIPTGILLLLALYDLASHGQTPNFASLAGFLVAYYSFLISLGVSLLLRVFTLYSYPAAMIDGVSGFRAVRYSFHVASHNLATTFTYAIVRTAFAGLLTLIALLGGVVGVPLSSLISAIIGLLLTPVLHSTKTMLYYHARPSIPETPYEITAPIWRDILRKLPRAAYIRVRLGLTEMGRFILDPRNIIFHVASVLSFILGIYLGVFVSNSGVADLYRAMGYQPYRGNPLIQQVFPPALGIDLFFHNWLVSIATALAGFGFGFPTFSAILLNGFILGIVLPLLPDTTKFLAAILPHGLIEIPSLLLAGSVGLRLGYVAWKTWFGRAATGELSKSLKQAVYIAIGLAPLFLIAGLIEADITPIIMRMFGWQV